jgi:hypothetical protein
LLKPAIEQMEAELGSHPLIAELLQFIRESKRGVMRSAGETGAED